MHTITHYLLYAFASPFYIIYCKKILSIYNLCGRYQNLCIQIIHKFGIKRIHIIYKFVFKLKYNNVKLKIILFYINNIKLET